MNFIKSLLEILVFIIQIVVCVPLMLMVFGISVVIVLAAIGFALILVLIATPFILVGMGYDYIKGRVKGRR